MPEHMNKYVVLKGFISGVAITVAILGALHFITMKGPVRLSATIRAVPWKLPVSVINELEDFEILQDPNFILQIIRKEYATEEFTQKITDKTEYHINTINDLLDIKSMYIIDIINTGTMKANHMIIEIPGADIVEVETVDRRGVKFIRLKAEIISLSDLYPGSSMRVTAWTTQKPTKECAEKVAIRHEFGPPIKIRVEAPLGALAHLIDNTILFVIVLSIFSLLITFLAWSRWKGKML